jgi:DNA-binding transcriptional LysR family regulator
LDIPDVFERQAISRWPPTHHSKIDFADKMRVTLVHDESLAIGEYAELAQISPTGRIKQAARRRSRCSVSATLNLNALLVFAKVAEASSFSEGARRLRIPISTVSRQVADLEAQLGVRLLERSTRSLRLTAIGAEVLEEARATLNVGESIQNLISSRSSGVSGLLRIAVPSSVANSLLASLVGAFQGSYPNVRVHMIISDRAVDLAADDFDLLVKIGPLRDSSWISRRILTFRNRLIASPAYLRDHKAPETPHELLGHRLIALSCEPKIEWSLVKDDYENGVTLTIEPYLSINDPTSLTDALLAGVGIGNLPSMAVGELLADGRLVELMPQWRFPALDVSLVHVSNRHVWRPVTEFIRFAVKSAPTLFATSDSSDTGKHEQEALAVA